MSTRRKILALGLILALSSQTVAVDYLHHHLVTGIPGHDLCVAADPGESPLAIGYIPGTPGAGHCETTCLFCIFLQNYHGQTTDQTFSSSGTILSADVPTPLPGLATLPGHLDHAGPRAPPSA